MSVTDSWLAGGPGTGSPWPGVVPVRGSRSAVVGGPAVASGTSLVDDQIAVPAKHGRSDEERCPPHPGQQSGQGRERHPVGRFQIGALDLTAKHGDRMTQNEDLTSFDRSRACPARSTAIPDAG